MNDVIKSKWLVVLAESLDISKKKPDEPLTAYQALGNRAKNTGGKAEVYP